MSMRDLTLGQMVLSLEYILKNQDAQKIIQKNKYLTMMMPMLEETLEKLIASRDMPFLGVLSPEHEESLRGKMRAVDAEFDDANRLLYKILELTSQHASDPAIREKSQFLNETLFPFRLRIVQMKWEEEAAEAKRMEQQLKKAHVKKFLSSLSIQMGKEKHTAWEVANHVVSSGKELGDLLLKLIGTEEESEASTRSSARRLFFKKMNRLIITLEDELDEHPEQIESILKAYHESLAETEQNKPNETETPNPETPTS